MDLGQSHGIQQNSKDNPQDGETANRFNHCHMQNLPIFSPDHLVKYTCKLLKNKPDNRNNAGKGYKR